ncbi:MAG: hypothetical protein ACFFER_11060 [Candidatus Thorarchaeota archaeon]
MKRYGNEMIRMLIAVVIAAAIISTGILIATYNVQTPDEPTLSTDHSADLPITPLSIIVHSGTDGTRVIADLEFGFKEYEYEYLIGYKRNVLEVRNGLNKSGVLGLGYSELRFYAFAYLGDVKLFDNWEDGVPQTEQGDAPSWTSHDSEGSHTGPIRRENITQLTRAGVILELIDFSIYFEDGTNFLCGPSRLAVGVNLTRDGDDWSTDYFFDASDNESLVFSSATAMIQLRAPVPIMTNHTSTTGTIPAPIDVPVVILTAPTIIAATLVLLIVLMARRRP